jgi:nicotinamidase-related amidase
MEKQYIVIIDPQKDFTHSQGNYATRHAGISQMLDAKMRINRLIGASDHKNIAIVFSDYVADQFGKNLPLCIPGTFGHELDIRVTASCSLIAKSEHSCFSSREFVTFLESNQTEALLIGGFLAEYCVRASALDALAYKYDVTLLKDCIGTGDDVQDRKKQMLEELHGRGARLLDSDFFVK